MSRFMKLGYVLTAATLVLAAGCADERPPRSYVQPNIIKVSDLVGDYYYIQTVTDAPPTNGSMFIGQSSSLMKIRFDVQEDYLYARRAYPQIAGSEDAYDKDPAHYKGQPLAAWRISKHFDIIRDFNSTTGEQTNKVIESEERPWNQREFIRVDWSQNLVTDYVGLGLDLFFSDGAPKVESVSYWESDPTNPDSLHVERAQADTTDGFKKDEFTYLDITNQLIVTPESLTAVYEENGHLNSFSYPKCFFAYEQDDCASQRVKVRHAFAKIAPQHDYQPRDWDGKQMELFGVWDVGLRRLKYDRQYGVTNSGVDRHAARFNIWQKSYKPDGKTLIPYKDRQIRQIPYYAEGSMTVVYGEKDPFPNGMVDSVFPPELYPQFVEIIKQWDDAMKVAVADVTGRKLTDAQKKQPLVFVPCHSPVRPEDAQICRDGLAPDRDAQGNVVVDKAGNPIFHARPGDPRHSTVFWVHQQQNAGPLGYGPPLYDDVTGETISGQAYIYGAAVDTYTARSRDLVLLENGEIDPADYTQGLNVQDWIEKQRAMKSGQSARAPKTTFEPEEILAMSRAMDFDAAKAFTPTNGYPQLDTSSSLALRETLHSSRMAAIGESYFKRNPAVRNERLSHIVGTPLEKMLASDASLMAASGVSPAKSWDQLSELEKIRLSPLRARAMQEQLARYRIGAEMRGVDFAAFDDPGLGQRAQQFTQKYGDQLKPHSDEIFKQLRAEIFLGVTLHEVGHNMGCRHNFRGSYDSMNYFPTYWNTRKEALDNPDKGMKAGDGKFHARYNNIVGGKVTAYEASKAIREYQYSSIMDYGAEFNSDLHGLGLYDKAFIKFSYAEYVEVFTDNKTDQASLDKMGALHTFQNALGFPSPLGPGAGLTAIAYQTYPELFNSGVEGIYKRQDVPFADIQSKAVAQGDQQTILIDKDGHPLVPYYFCSDEFAGNLTCQRFDSGADAYEQTADIISRYQNFYLLNNFKRDRQSFHSSLGYKDRIASRYFDKLRETLTWYVLLRDDFQSFLSENAQLGGGDANKVIQQENKFFTDEGGWGNFTIAVSLGFDTLGQVLATPSAGQHFSWNAPDGQTYYKHFDDDTTHTYSNTKKVDLIDGKYIDTKWDFSGCGYYWAEECQSRIGYMVDKTVALDVLSEQQAYFTGRDTNVDVRQYAIGYYQPFKAQIQEKFGALFSNDLKSFAPYIVTVDGQDAVKQPSWVLDDPTVVKKALVDPQASFTLALYAGVYGLASFPTGFDHDFVDTTKIFVVGNGEASVSDAKLLDPSVSTSDPKQLVSRGGNREWFVITDPVSGKTFAAHASPARTGVTLDPASPTMQTSTTDLRIDIGVRMLERMQSLGAGLVAAKALPDGDKTKQTKLANAQLEFDKFRQNLEVMRSLHNAFGYGPYKTDAPFYY